MREKKEKNFWDTEIIGNRRKKVFLKENSYLSAPTFSREISQSGKNRLKSEFVISCLHNRMFLPRTPLYFSKIFNLNLVSSVNFVLQSHSSVLLYRVLWSFQIEEV